MKVIRETKVINQVKTVRKYDRKTYRFVVDLVLEFMHDAQ